MAVEHPGLFNPDREEIVEEPTQRRESASLLLLVEEVVHTNESQFQDGN